MESLSRERLTAALAARQLLLERASLSPADAIRHLTPLQGQHPPAPYIGLAARLDGFSRAALETELEARRVVKSTLLRLTLHLVEAGDYPAYAQLARQFWLRKWRTTYPHLDEEKVVAELGDWLGEPRTNAEIRDRVRGYDGVPDDAFSPIWFARVLLPVIQLPPAGFYGDTRRNTGFVIDPRPRPGLVEAAAHVIRRYLTAFGPAQKRDVAAWLGAAQRDFAAAWEHVETVAYRDEEGRTLFDLPGQPLPPADTPLPPRLLGHWDQALLAYEDRDRIIPPELKPLKLTLSGSPTVTVDGRVAASWTLRREGDDVTVTIEPHVDIARSATTAIRDEAERTARICEPDAHRYEVAF
jgi:phosphatidylserine/phosphatidylglycerophosphate/cardiolipin synthase-like enzyme